MRTLQDYNELRTKAGRAPVGFRLTAVDKVANPVLEHRFALRHKALQERAENKCSAEELRERFAFHGELTVAWLLLRAELVWLRRHASAECSQDLPEGPAARWSRTESEQASR